MSDVQGQAAKRLRIIPKNQKAATSSLITSSLASSTTPILASPTRGFGLQVDTALPEITQQESFNSDLKIVESVFDSLGLIT